MPSGIYIRTEEHKKNIGLSRIGKPSKNKGRLSKNKGKTFVEIYGKERAEKIRKNLSLVHIGKPGYWSGRIGPMKNKHHTGEARKSMKKFRSEEAKKNMRGSKSEKHKENLRKPKTEKHRKNMSLAKKILWQEPDFLRNVGKKEFGPFQNTSIEIKLQNILRENNITFILHKPIFGIPDIFIKPNICIFADGDFWHCNPKFYKGVYFHPVIKMLAVDIWKRDSFINKVLIAKGYKVLRFWEYDIDNDLVDCFKQIKKIGGNYVQ